MRIVAGVGLGIGLLIALLTGAAMRSATQTGRAVRETETRLSGLRDAQLGARFKAVVLIVATTGYFLFVVYFVSEY
jgi:hypothetical protein